MKIKQGKTNSPPMRGEQKKQTLTMVMHSTLCGIEEDELARKSYSMLYFKSSHKPYGTPNTFRHKYTRQDLLQGFESQSLGLNVQHLLTSPVKSKGLRRSHVQSITPISYEHKYAAKTMQSDKEASTAAVAACV